MPPDGRSWRAALAALGLFAFLNALLIARYCLFIRDFPNRWLVAGGFLVLLSVLSWGVALHSSERLLSTTWTAISAIFGAELLLQAVAVPGWLPRVSYSYKAPYALVYWTKEGFARSRMNSRGWHTGEPTHGATDIVLIGDSHVEAVQVGRQRHLEAHLSRLLERSRKRPVSVLALGMSGVGPAYYLELLRLADVHYRPREAIIFVFLGNDFSDSSARLRRDVAASNYIFYSLKGDEVVLDPASVPVRELLRRKLEFGEKGPLPNLPRTILGNLFSAGILVTARDAQPTRVKTDAGWVAAPRGQEQSIFEKSWSPEAEESFRVASALLLETERFARAHGFKLRVVTIPHFVGGFFSQQGTDWKSDLGEQDLLVPEERLERFADTHGMTLLATGRELRRRSISVESIKSLYLGDGRGHLSERGHEFFARLVYESFYAGVAGNFSPASPTGQLTPVPPMPQ